MNSVCTSLVVESCQRYPPDRSPYTGVPLSRGSREEEAPLSEIDRAPVEGSIGKQFSGSLKVVTILQFTTVGQNFSELPQTFHLLLNILALISFACSFRLDKYWCLVFHAKNYFHQRKFGGTHQALAWLIV